MDRKASKGSLRTKEILQRAQEYDFRDTLPNDEYEALTEMIPKLRLPDGYDSQCFVLGSYDTETNEKQRLLYLQREIEKWSGENCRAFLMEDFPDELHQILQFKLIADHSDYIVGICEHDEGGFQLEFGMLVALMNYFDRFHLLKRRYPDPEKEREKYNGMLNPDVFGMFEYHDRLWEWEDQREYKVEVTNLLSQVLR